MSKELRVVGVQYVNEDGSSRQTALREMLISGHDTVLLAIDRKYRLDRKCGYRFRLYLTDEIIGWCAKTRVDDFAREFGDADYCLGEISYQGCYNVVLKPIDKSALPQILNDAKLEKQAYLNSKNKNLNDTEQQLEEALREKEALEARISSLQIKKNVLEQTTAGNAEMVNYN